MQNHYVRLNGQIIDGMILDLQIAFPVELIVEVVVVLSVVDVAVIDPQDDVLTRQRLEHCPLLVDRR